MITIALPKGRLGDKVYELLNRAGYGFEAMEDVGRKLVIEDEEKQIRYLLVKPVDVAVYVEKGAADLGVVGKDILEESGADILSCWIWASASATCVWRHRRASLKILPDG